MGGLCITLGIFLPRAIDTITTIAYYRGIPEESHPRVEHSKAGATETTERAIRFSDSPTAPLLPKTREKSQTRLIIVSTH